MTAPYFLTVTNSINYRQVESVVKIITIDKARF